jgi:hypothetical protein
MNLPRSILVFLIIIALVSTSVWLFTQRSTAIESRDEVEAGLASSLKIRGQLVAEQPGLEAQLQKASEEKEEWQAKIAVAQQALDTAKEDLAACQAELPGKIEDLDYNEILLAMCQACGLEVVGMETAEPDQTEISEAMGFMAHTFTINVRGTVPQILELYNTIVTDNGFRTASLEPVVINQPLPVTEKARAELADEFYVELLSELEVSFTPEERVIMIEEAVLVLLDEECEHITVEEMTRRILDTIAADFGEKIAAELAAEIAGALENELAASLITTISDIYGSAIGELFEEGEPELTPKFLGLLGEQITQQLLLLPPEKIPGVVTGLISDKLNRMVRDRIESMVDLDEVARLVADVVEQAEKATGVITITVTTYEGGADVQG